MPTKKKTISSYEVRADIFDAILYEYEACIEVVESVGPYMKGYHNKNTIYYENNISTQYMIIRECIVNHFCNEAIQNCTDWKQIRIRRIEDMIEPIKKVTDGATAWRVMRQLLEPYYNDQEFEAALLAHQMPEDQYISQLHYTASIERDSIYKYTNCYYYDINGAHMDALIEIFPKAKKALMDMYAKRKKNPVYKSYPNFFVGMLGKKNRPYGPYRNTYYWIVNRTSKLLMEAEEKVNGIIIYENTDGFIVANPKNTLDVSNKLGEFKEEYAGDVYIGRTKNYLLYQLGDEQKGMCLKTARKDMDLSKGELIQYDRKAIEVGPCKIFKPENIKKEIVEIKNGN